MDKLKELYIAFVLYRHNCQALHWKMSGLDFDTIHELMNKYIDFMHEGVDTAAEMLLMLGQNPPCLIGVCDEVKTGETNFVYVDTEGSYTTADVFKNLQLMMDHLIPLCQSISEDESLPKGIHSEVDGLQYWLLVEGKYKQPRRLFTNQTI